MPSYTRKVDLPGKTAQELFDKVSSEIDRFLSKLSVGNFDVARDPAGKKVSVSGSLFSATLTCSEGSMKVDAKLSLLASPFRSKIDEGIDRWLQKTFGPTA